MYNGYRIGNHDIYNPWSIINYADSKELIPYWVNTSANVMIRDCIKKISKQTLYAKNIFDNYNSLVVGGELKTTLNLTSSFYEIETVSSLWGLFVNSGYLTISQKEKKGSSLLYTLKIPNDEVREEFKQITLDYMNSDCNIIDEMIISLLDINIENFIYMYSLLMVNIPSYYDLKEENSYVII
jgi:hypothetical protein